VANDLSVSGESERIDTFREVAWGALVLLALLLVVFWRPIALFGTHTFAAADLVTQATSLTRIDGEHELANNLVSDPVLQMQPWALFSKREFAAGRAPLWNPYNETGVPLLANCLSAPFSPFALPYYVLPFKAALIAATLAELLALGLFMFLFLREIGCARFASLAGGFAFATSGFALLWHQCPHVGAMVALPGGLYFAERVLAAIERGAKRAPLGLLIGLALVLGGATLAGQPEILAYSLVVLALYCAWRAIEVFARARDLARVLRAAGALVLAGILGAAIAAIQLAPFAEYLALSSAVTGERGAQVPLAAVNWPLQFFPNLAGTPVESRTIDPGLPSPNFQEFTSFYLGGAVLFLALAALCFLRRERRVQFFAACAGVWLLYAWDAFGLALWLGRETLLRHIPIHRTQPFWLPAACVLAAWAIDKLRRTQFAHPRRVAAVVVVAGAAFWAVFRVGAESYLTRIVTELGIERSTLPAVCTEQLTTLSIVFGVAVLAVALPIVSRAVLARRISSAVLLGALLCESGALLGNYIPAVEDRFVYPHTPAIESLRSQVGDGRLLVLSPDTLRADTNLQYQLHLVWHYDALGLADVDRLNEHFFGASRGAIPMQANKKALDLFGVTYVATKSDWIPIDTDLGDLILPRYHASAYLLGELTPDRPTRPLFELASGATWKHEFAASRPGFDALCLHLLDDQAALARHVVVSLRDVERDTLIVQHEFALADLRRLPDRRRELVLTFGGQADSRGRKYELSAISPDAASGAVARIARGGKGKGYLPADSGDRRDEAGPALDLAYGQSEFAACEKAGEHSLWHYKAGARARVVARALVASSHEAALELVESPDFDPRSAVVLEDAQAPTPANASLTAQVRLVDETPLAQHWSVDSSGAGWLVLAQSFYPGWTARLDGAEVALHRANYAFTALAVPAGEHEVALAYEPASYRSGRSITLASLSLIIAAMLLARLRRKLESR
jgi:hypothetical protein